MLTITSVGPGWTIAGIAVKGGDGYNWYAAGPWSNLHAPEAGKSGSPAKISHWVACGSYVPPADKVVAPESPWVEPDIACDAKTVTVNIPTMLGVTYRVGATTVSGSHVVTVDGDGKYKVTVTADVADDFTLAADAETSWTIEGKVDTCPTPPTRVTPLAPSVLGDVLCGADEVTVSIPSVPGVAYEVEGETVTGSVDVAVKNGSYSVTITAAVADGFEFAQGADTSWTIHGEVAKCPTPPITPPGNPQVQPLTVSFTQQCVITGGIDITAEVTNPNGSPATATFHGQAVTVPANGKASIKAHLAAKAHAEVLVDGTAIDAVTAIDDTCAVEVGGVKITATPKPTLSASPSVSVKGVKLADTGANFPLGQATLIAGLLVAGGALLLVTPKLGVERRRRH